MNLIIKKFARSLAVVASVAALTLSSVSLINNGRANAFSVGGPTDCDSNAVIYCGATASETLIAKYNGGDGRNSTSSVRDIYNYFGISSADIQSLNTSAVAGRVTKSGQVYVNSSPTPVATNALTAGRGNMSGSSQVTNGGTTFYTRAPAVSFLSDSLPAYVVMQNGQFKYAIIASCGNPVKATPTTQPTSPNYTVEKLVAPKGTNNFSKSTTVENGQHVVYQVAVKSTGDAPVTNLNVSDQLPTNVTFVPGTLTRNGQTLSAAEATSFFSTGNVAGTLNPGQTVTYQFEAVVGNSDPNAVCNNETLVNITRMTGEKLPPGSSSATVNKTCNAKPVCTYLGIKQEGRTVTVTQLTYNLNGATFKSVYVDWGENGAKTDTYTDQGRIVGQSYTYQGNGPFTIVAHVVASQNGKDIAVEGNGCKQQVSFTPPPVVTATKPTQLANTGPGSVMALFAAVTVAGAFGHRWFMSRRLSGPGGSAGLDEQF